MILSDRDIRNRLEADGGLEIDEMDLENQLQPASLDIRLGHEFAKTPNDQIIDPENEDVEYNRFLVDHKGYVVDPGEFLLGTTKETIKLPRDLVAKVEGRSSYGRLGVIIHATAGFIDAGFQGQITLEISNIASSSVRLRPNTRIGQLVFHQLDTPSEVPYGDKPDAKYQGQQGPVGSKLGETKPET